MPFTYVHTGSAKLTFKVPAALLLSLSGPFESYTAIMFLDAFLSQSNFKKTFTKDVKNSTSLINKVFDIYSKVSLHG